MNTPQGKAHDPAEVGRRSVMKWSAVCPYPEGSKEANEWADGLLEGRESLVWNIRHLVMLGAISRWASEAISLDLGTQLAREIFHFGAESLVYFRIGFVLSGHDQPVPCFSPREWIDLAHMARRGIQGRPIHDSAQPIETTWQHRLAFLEGRDFLHNLLDGTPPTTETGRPAQIDIPLRKLLAWIGGSSEHRAELIPSGA